MNSKVKLRLFLVIGIFLLIIGCSNNDTEEANVEESESFNKTDFPIVDESIEIEFMTGRPPTTAEDYNKVTSWETYEEMTNIKIDWGLTPKEGLSEKVNLALAGDGLPEAFYRSNVSNLDIMKYGEQGAFLELNDLIEKYMPNLTQVLEEYPEIRKGLTFPDGSIYGLPTIYDPDYPSLLMGPKFWIREDWLDQLNMDVPSTTDELYDYLKAVKETDLIGDGSDDEIPYAATSITGLQQWLHGSFGVNNRGNKNQFVDMDPETDELRFFPITDNHKKLLEYMNKLYREGLISENIYTIDTNQYHSQSSEGVYGSTIISNPSTHSGEEYGLRYIGVPALEGPDGDRKLTKVSSSLAHMKGMILTKNNKHVPETLRWMDHFYSKEGSLLFFLGVEGVSYEEDGDGKFDYLDEINNPTDGSTRAEKIADHSIYAGGGYPGLVMEDSFKGSESLPQTIEVADMLEPYMIDEVWPEFTFTNEEAKNLEPISADIEKFVKEMQDKFIVGDLSFSEWDDFVEKVENMKLDEYLKIYQQALDRYNKN